MRTITLNRQINVIRWEKTMSILTAIQSCCRTLPERWVFLWAFLLMLAKSRTIPNIAIQLVDYDLWMLCQQLVMVAMAVAVMVVVAEAALSHRSIRYCCWQWFWCVCQFGRAKPALLVLYTISSTVQTLWKPNTANYVASSFAIIQLLKHIWVFRMLHRRLEV